MPVVPHPSRQDRSVLKLSLGISLIAVVTIIIAIFAVGAPEADAAVCTWTTGAGNWTNPASWQQPQCNNTYPGAAAGDTANFTFGATATVDAPIPNGVVLALNGFGAAVSVPAAGSLQLEESSTLGSSGNTITVSGGTLNLHGTATLFSAVSIGTIQLNSGSVNNLGPVTFTSGNTVNIAGGTFTNSSGTITFSPGAILALSGGTLTNNVANGIAISGGPSSGATFNWSGGLFNGSGSTAIQSGSVGGALNLTGSAGPMTLDTQTIGHAGVANYSAPSTAPLTINNGGGITNDGAFTLNTDTPINSNLAGSPFFDNKTGTFTKHNGVSSNINVPFDNDNGGTVTATNDASAVTETVNFNGGGTQAGSFTCNVTDFCTYGFGGSHSITAGTSFTAPTTSVVVLSGGTFGTGTNLTIPGSLTNSGTIDFLGGTSHTIAPASYTQNASGTLDVRLFAASASDQVTASGSAQLAGTIGATLLYAPSDFDSWNPVTYTSLVGDFTTRNLPTYSRGVIVELAPSATAITLQAIPQSDISIVKTGPVSVLDGQNATFTIKVANLGPATPANVSISDTFTGGTFVSATPTIGSCSGTGPITCSFPSLATGTPAFVTVVLQASGVGTLSNTATLSSSNPADPNSANDSSTANVSVTAAADLLINSVSGSPNPVNASQNETWTVHATNNGPDAATSAVINLTLTGGTVSSASSSNLAFTCSTTPSTVQCSAPSFAASGTTTITVVSVAQAQGGSTTLNANISSSTTDPVSGNNSGSATVTVTAVADLAVTKVLSGSLVAGQNATYTVTVTNNGPSDAAAVQVSDATPAGFTFVSNSGACTTAFPCSLGTLTSGSTVMITTTYAVSSGAPSTVSNTATVSSTTSDLIPGNNSSTATNPVSTSADLAINKVLSSPLVAGQNATYTITVTNNGPSDAAAVQVNDSTPAGLTFVSNSGACTTAFPCNLGTLIAGSSATITTTYSVPSTASGTVNNTATVSSATSDSIAGNNTSTATNTIGASADVSIAKTLSGALVAGQIATYTVTVANNGPSDATGVQVSDTTPPGLTFISNTGACTTPYPCSLGTVTNGSSVTITSQYSVPSNASGTVSNTATVSSTTTDSIAGNNSSTATNAVSVSADPSITKALSGSLVAGQAATYTITVTNNGPSDATGVQVSDATPPGLTFVSNTGACTTPYPCSLGTVLGNSSVTITSTYSVPSNASGTVSNTATVSSATPDTNAGNNTSTATNAIVVSADVQITKTLITPLVAGSSATYSITVTNAGPSDANNVSMTDNTPPGLTQSSVAGCASVTPCSIGTLTAGSSVTVSVTYSVPANASGSVTNTATVSSTTPDSNAANNTAQVTTPIQQSADLVVTKTGPSTAVPGSKVGFTIKVTNNGPSDAANVTLDDPTPARLTFVSASAPCSAGFSSPCSLGTLTAGQTKTVFVTYSVQAGSSSTITNTATANSTTPDPNSGNNSGSATLTSGCPSTPTNLSPPDGATNQPVTGILQWSDAGAASYNVFFGPQGTGCTTPFATTKSPAVRYQDIQGGTTYEWRVEAVTPGCPIQTSSCTKFTTIATCPTTPPTLISPLNVTVNGPTTFTWSSVPGATGYQLIVNGAPLTTTADTSFGPVSVANGPVTWSVIAQFNAPCPSLTSASGSFNSCDSSAKTIPSIIAQAETNQTYQLLWDAVSGASKYEADEATDVSFTNPTTFSTTTTSLSFQHSVNAPTAFFYRVRAFFDCANGFGPNSVSVRVVLLPAIASINPNVSAPAGSTTVIPIIVHIPGFPDGTFAFTASLDPQDPWLVKVEPTSGLLPPEGVDLNVFADPTGLSDGTHTGTVIVLVTTPSSKGLAANGTTPVGAPVSISLVTPVTPKPSGPPPANALIIPSTGHLDGINSRWASDVRILNTSSQTVHYQITFTPDDISQGVKQTVIQTAAGTTTALDDVVKTWYGVGSLGESSNGALEIRPLDNPSGKTGSADAPSISFTTVASSRTYNAAPSSTGGTLGEFIPAIAFQNFIGKAIDSAHAATILSLQQVAQNDALRTNFGVMEASGQPVSVLVSVFDATGKKLLDTPLTLLGGQHAQLNGFLAQNKIALPDGRIQAQVLGGDGKITAYASVIDNKSGDPVLVSGVPLGQTVADHFVLPGVADLNTAIAAWRTDARIFNPTTSAQSATLTFYPVNSQGQPQSTSITINPGEVKQLDNTLQSVFGLNNIGGAIHVQTATPAPLVISARTYNLTSNGTFGQLTTAVTATDAIGQGDTPLQIVQTEDSVRQRTNVGLFEVTGKPATVEITVFLPDSKIAPSTQIPLPANGYVQIPVIQSFGLSNVYNARVSMRVVAGDGRIGAYGSVIDQVTQDPTYVPAQR